MGAASRVHTPPEVHLHSILVLVMSRRTHRSPPCRNRNSLHPHPRAAWRTYGYCWPPPRRTRGATAGTPTLPMRPSIEPHQHSQHRLLLYISYHPSRADRAQALLRFPCLNRLPSLLHFHRRCSRLQKAEADWRTTWSKSHGRSTATFGGSTLRRMKSTRNRKLTPSLDVPRMHRTQVLDRRRGLDAESDILPQGLLPTTAYGRFRYLRDVARQPVEAPRTRDSCSVTRRDRGTQAEEPGQPTRQQEALTRGPFNVPPVRGPARGAFLLS